MASKESAIRDLLKANGSWAALVSGGTYILDELNPQGFDLNNLPASVAAVAIDANGLLNLVAVITYGTSAEAEVAGNTERAFMQLWLYHNSSYTLVRQARRLAKNLLDRKQVSTTDEGSPLLYWVNDVPEFRADELGGAVASSSRYAVQFGRY